MIPLLSGEFEEVLQKHCISKKDKKRNPKTRKLRNINKKFGGKMLISGTFQA